MIRIQAGPLSTAMDIQPYCISYHLSNIILAGHIRTTHGPAVLIFIFLGLFRPKKKPPFGGFFTPAWQRWLSSLCQLQP